MEGFFGFPGISTLNFYVGKNGNNFQIRGIYDNDNKDNVLK